MTDKSALGAVLCLAILLAGCMTAGGLVEALAKDPASVCVTAVTLQGTVRLYRTNIRNGAVVCDEKGMQVKQVAGEIE